MQTTLSMKSIVSLRETRNGKSVLEILHPKTKTPMMMFLLEPGSSAVAKRAIKAYQAGDGDADAFFHAQGMSDAEAFSDIWK